MNFWERILLELSTPNDQGRDWYAWLTNQMSHILLGLTIASLMLLYWDNEYALLAVVIFAVSKEVYDLSVGGKLKDSVQDIIFQVLGGILCLAIYNQDMMILESVIIISVLGLFLGVVPRIKAAL